MQLPKFQVLDPLLANPKHYFLVCPLCVEKFSLHSNLKLILIQCTFPDIYFLVWPPLNLAIIWFVLSWASHSCFKNFVCHQKFLGPLATESEVLHVLLDHEMVCPVLTVFNHPHLKLRVSKGLFICFHTFRLSPYVVFIRYGIKSLWSILQNDLKTSKPTQPASSDRVL